MPPCAATVCERVGKTLVMQAVLQPLLGHAERGAQAGTAGADDHHVEFVVDIGIGLAAGCCRRGHASASECQFEQREDGERRRPAIAKKVLSISSASLPPSPCT